MASKDCLVNALSIADFAMASTFIVREKASISLAGFIHIQRWVDHMESRPAW